MKAKSNAKMMTRKQERLLEQRRRQHVRLLEQQASEDVDQQLRVRRHGETTVSSWWRSADDDDGTKRDTTYWSSSYGSHAVPRAIMMSTLTPTTTPRDGYRSRSTTACLTPAESWPGVRLSPCGYFRSLSNLLLQTSHKMTKLLASSRWPVAKPTLFLRFDS
ncbi:hypothetical protein PR001_g32424 [Phytophthora rubi]|uniref:Uncharacterized protein n=1 Tax=Phytophthora rubi TaxID=129364 RepID=A0A6A3GCM3_9STRA|nr:hypothetical protein PR001_g32424 [Phytophthora rubi]